MEDDNIPFTKFMEVFDLKFIDYYFSFIFFLRKLSHLKKQKRMHSFKKKQTEGVSSLFYKNNFSNYD